MLMMMKIKHGTGRELGYLYILLATIVTFGDIFNKIPRIQTLRRQGTRHCRTGRAGQPMLTPVHEYHDSLCIKMCPEEEGCNGNLSSWIRHSGCPSDPGRDGVHHPQGDSVRINLMLPRKSNHCVNSPNRPGILWGRTYLDVIWILEMQDRGMVKSLIDLCWWMLTWEINIVYGGLIDNLYMGRYLDNGANHA